MTGTEIVMLTCAVVFLGIVIALVVSRKKGGSKTSLNPLTGSFVHEQGAEPAGIVIKDTQSHEGGLTATNHTGSGVLLDGIDVKKNVTATNNPPPSVPKA